MKTKEIIMRYGYSESAWKSLVIKSVRIGWVEGLEAASKILPKSVTKTLLIGALFEDLFPVRWEDFNAGLEECYNLDFEKLCTRATLHERGYANDFVDMGSWACDKSGGIKYGYDIAMPDVQKNSSLKYVHYRLVNVLATWHKINPKDVNVKRNPLRMEFRGIPECVLDSHTYEGKKFGLTGMNFLSGHYENHRIMGKMTNKIGWGGLREKFKTEKIFPVEKESKNLQKLLFE